MLNWMGRQGIETFYAIAVTDADAARQVHALGADLVAACEDELRLGGRPRPDQEWLGTLTRVLADLDGRIAWQALRLRHSG